MSIRQNLQYAQNSESDVHMLDEVIELMELKLLQNRKPATLSGGQQQRVALAQSPGPNARNLVAR